MQFECHRPPARLAGTVKVIWMARGTKAEFVRPDPIVPDGCVEIIFNLADPFVGEDGRQQPRTLLAGQMTRPVTAVATGDVDLIGVRFWPGRAGASLRTPMWTLRDQLVSASDVMPTLDALSDDLRNIGRNARLEFLWRDLIHRFSAVRPDRLAVVDRAVSMIHATNGVVRVDAVARRIGTTRRQLERRFRDEVGLTVKDLARIARLHAALRLIESPHRVPGAIIAAECGYSDQAHLIRECRELTGRTPGRLNTTESTLAGLLREAPSP